MSQATPTAEIAREVRPMLDGMVQRHGPVAVARGLFHTGCKLIAQVRGRGEAQAELQRHLAKAHVRAKAHRDVDGEPIGRADA